MDAMKQGELCNETRMNHATAYSILPNQKPITPSHHRLGDFFILYSNLLDITDLPLQS